MEDFPYFNDIISYLKSFLQIKLDNENHHGCIKSGPNTALINYVKIAKKKMIKENADKMNELKKK